MKRLLILLSLSMFINAELSAAFKLKDFVLEKPDYEYMVEDDINNKVYLALNLQSSVTKDERQKRVDIVNSINAPLHVSSTRAAGAGGGSGYSYLIKYCYKVLENKDLGYEMVFYAVCPDDDIWNPGQKYKPELRLIKILLKDASSAYADEDYQFVLSRKDSDSLLFRTLSAFGANLDCRNEGKCVVTLSHPRKKRLKSILNILTVPKAYFLVSSRAFGWINPYVNKPYDHSEYQGIAE